MSRLLFRLSYTAWSGLACLPAHPADHPTLNRAPIRNRTVDLLLTMETLCRLSYWGDGTAAVTVQVLVTERTTATAPA